MNIRKTTNMYVLYNKHNFLLDHFLIYYCENKFIYFFYVDINYNSRYLVSGELSNGYNMAIYYYDNLFKRIEATINSFLNLNPFSHYSTNNN